MQKTYTIKIGNGVAYKYTKQYLKSGAIVYTFLKVGGKYPKWDDIKYVFHNEQARPINDHTYLGGALWGK